MMLGEAAQRAPSSSRAGGARNRCLVEIVREGLGAEVLVPEDPQRVGAPGAALLAAS
jgi:activator of 2-hydroxyglutaryl-CoA dehydratase